jgi:hypothetical protein
LPLRYPHGVRRQPPPGDLGSSRNVTLAVTDVVAMLDGYN